MTDTLLGHLAQFASFSKQGELLCTQSLAFPLRDATLRAAVGALVARTANCAEPQVFEWRAEVRQEDGGRPDLEGRAADGKALIKVEGKLGAAFGSGQVTSYVNGLCRAGCPTILLVIVPARRYKEACGHVSQSLQLPGEGPWQAPLASGVAVAVVSWEDVVGAMERAATGEAKHDVLQLKGMYRALNGDDFEPLTSEQDIVAWKLRMDWWNRLADVVSRTLTRSGDRLLPIDLEKSPKPYYRRYVCRRFAGGEVCASIGTCDPFEGFETPLWLRFHRRTPHFATIAANLERAAPRLKSVPSGRHLWFPLEVPLNADRDAMIAAVTSQVDAVRDTAYQSLLPE